MAKIRCESGYSHYNKDGTVLRGRVTPLDTGVMQISRKHHEVEAERLGLDLENVWDNIAYGRLLFEREGDAPWLAPTDCNYLALN